MPPTKSKLIFWQKPMVTVLYALIPSVLAGVYFFGWRVLLVLAVSLFSAALTEWLFLRHQGKPITSAAFVTGALLALILPATIPLWMAAVGSAAGIAFGKMMLGGFGRNPFNPALVGRCFLYICFPYQMTGRFWIPHGSGLRGLAFWTPSTADALTSATPLGLWREMTHSYQYNFWDLYLGNVGGSIGETCALAILLGGVFLLLKKVASWRVMVGVILGAGLVSCLGMLMGVEKIPDPIFTFGSGGLLFGLVFMATDPVSGSSTNPGKWIMGFGVGALTVILRSYSIFAGAVMFAILLMNTVTPLIDFLIKQYAQSRKARSAA